MSVRGMLIAVGFLGLWMGTARWWATYNFATVYASGYREENFRRVRPGMTPSEVKSILGCPIRKLSDSARRGDSENWIYSEPPPPGTIGDNYWRRWVFFEDGKVTAILNDYYVD